MSTHYQFGIQNYQPDFVDSTDELLKKRADFFNQLIGKTLLSVFTVWSKEHNEEWLNAPVVIKFNDLQVELCANKTDELSVTIDTFDLNTAINWYGDDRFEWRKYAKLDRNFKIENINIIELKNEISNVSGNPGFKNSWWSLGGIQFIGESGQISVYNGFDCNFITSEPLMERVIRTKKLQNFR